MTFWRPLTHVALPDDDRAALTLAIRENGNVSHAQFVRDVLRWRAGFRQVPGDAVALYFDDAVEFSAALFGAWHADKHVVLLADAQPTTIERVLPHVAACAGSLPGGLTPADHVPSDDVLTPLSLEHTTVALFTSGSTGEPEPINKNLAQLNAEIHTLQEVFGQEIDSHAPARVYATVSHQHIYGLLFRVLWPLAAGRPTVAKRLSYPEDIIASLSSASNAVLVSSPALLSRLPEHLDWSGLRSGLRAVFSSGGPLSLEAALRCHRLMGRSPTEVFGSSETGGIAWRRRADMGEAWRVLPKVQWRISDGTLEVRSAHLQDPRLWWRTSDQVDYDASIEGQDRFIFKGRSDRIVKIAEKRVSLTALEVGLLQCPEVSAVRTLLMQGARPSATDRIAAVVALTDAGWQRLFEQGRRSMNEYLRGHLQSRVETVALPRAWRYVEHMPVNEQGKTTQQSLLQQFRPMQPQANWLEQDEHHAQLELKITEDLLVFDGHFPQAPLVPGVAQLHWIHRLAHQAFPIPGGIAGIEALKFKQPIVPGQNARLTMHWDSTKSAVRFSFDSEAGSHASGRLVFKAAS